MTGDIETDGAAPINLHQLFLPIVQVAKCEVCQTPFEVARRRGRPQVFCSDFCRSVQLKQQKKHWAMRQAGRGT